MPAKNALKEYHENGYYHLYNRGVNKGLIFSDDKDYKMFLYYLKVYLCSTDLQVEYLKVSPSRKLKNYCSRLKLLAYCLMPNHFHLLVWQKDPEAINYFMRSLTVKYAMYFNRRHKRTGPLFQGVYKAVLVENEPQLIYLTKYIHRNPLKLPSSRVLEGYKYSSYQNYLSMFNQDWVKTKDILDYFSKTKVANSYRSFVEEVDERDLPMIKSLVLEEV
jgi:putative transposase